MLAWVLPHLISGQIVLRFWGSENFRRNFVTTCPGGEKTMKTYI